MSNKRKSGTVIRKLLPAMVMGRHEGRIGGHKIIDGRDVFCCKSKEVVLRVVYRYNH